MSDSSSSWLQTYTGRAFDLLNPDPTEVTTADIAHALAMQCRFTGHCLSFYSIAHHSLIMSDCIAASERQRMSPDQIRRFRLLALLHDASEAYVGDISHPLKYIPAMRAIIKPIEDAIQSTVLTALEVDPPTKEEADFIKLCDLRMLASERLHLMRPADHEWGIDTMEDVSPFPSRLFQPSWESYRNNDLSEIARRFSLRLCLLTDSALTPAVGVQTEVDGLT